MLEGTEVLWEEKLSYYDLMVMRLTEDVYKRQSLTQSQNQVVRFHIMM